MTTKISLYKMTEVAKTCKDLVNDDIKVLSINNHNSCSLASLAKAMKQNTSLLCFRFCCVFPLQDRHVRVLAEALHVHSSIRVLSLERGHISNDGISMLAEALKANSSLCEVSISEAEMGHSGVLALVKALKDNRTILKLNLRSSSIQTAGARAIRELLEVNFTLRNLNLAGNVIEEEGAWLIAQALKVNSSLRNLDLTNNAIGADGAQALAEALKLNSSLRVLNLGTNDIRNAGAKALAEALKVNGSLCDLDLHDNYIRMDGFEALGESLKINTGLRCIVLNHNCPECRELPAILAEPLKDNITLTEISFSGLILVGEEIEEYNSMQTFLKRNKAIRKENAKRRKAILLYRRSFQAWRDRSRIFIPAREGRLMELRVRLRWGAKAGGLSLKGECDGELMTPIEAAWTKRRRQCYEMLMRAKDETEK